MGSMYLYLLLFWIFKHVYSDEQCKFTSNQGFYTHIPSDLPIGSIIFNGTLFPESAKMKIGNVRSDRFSMEYSDRIIVDQDENSGNFLVRLSSQLSLPRYPSSVKTANFFVTVTCNGFAYPLFTIHVNPTNRFSPKFYGEPYLVRIPRGLPIWSVIETPIAAIDWDPEESYRLRFFLEDSPKGIELLKDVPRRTSRTLISETSDWAENQLPTSIRLRITGFYELPMTLRISAVDPGNRRTTTFLNIVERWNPSFTSTVPTTVTRTTTVTTTVPTTTTTVPTTTTTIPSTTTTTTELPEVIIDSEVAKNFKKSKKPVDPIAFGAKNRELNAIDLPESINCENLQFSIKENSPKGTKVGKLPDFLKNSTIRLIDPDSTFEIGNSKIDKNQYLIVKNPKLLDREMFNTLGLIAEFDKIDNCSRIRIYVDLEDENDNRPVFESEHYFFHVAPRFPIGGTVGTLVAQDIDQGINGQISYHLMNSEEVPFQVGTQGKKGVLMTTRPLDPTVYSYNLTVEARDHGELVQKATRIGVEVFVLGADKVGGHSRGILEVADNADKVGESSEVRTPSTSPPSSATILEHSRGILEDPKGADNADNAPESADKPQESPEAADNADQSNEIDQDSRTIPEHSRGSLDADKGGEQLGGSTSSTVTQEVGESADNADKVGESQEEEDSTPSTPLPAILEHSTTVPEVPKDADNADKARESEESADKAQESRESGEEDDSTPSTQLPAILEDADDADRVGESSEDADSTLESADKPRESPESADKVGESSENFQQLSTIPEHSTAIPEVPEGPENADKVRESADNADKARESPKSSDDFQQLSTVLEHSATSPAIPEVPESPEDADKVQESRESAEKPLESSPTSFHFHQPSYFYTVLGMEIRENDVIGRVSAHPNPEFYAVDREVSGILKIDENGDILAGKLLNRHEDGEIRFGISATNGIETARAQVTILRDAAGDPLSVTPQFDQDVYRFEIRENQPSEFVGVVRAFHSALSQDQKLSLTYSLVAKKRIPFEIHEKSGEISSLESLDAEEHKFWRFQTRACLTATVCSTADVIIHVADQNDNPPVLLNRKLEASVESDAPIGTKIAKLIANDQDSSDENSRVAFSISNDDSGVFEIDAAGQIRTAQLLTRPLYTLLVQVSDGGIPPKSDNGEVTVHVRGTNPSPPVFDLKNGGKSEISGPVRAGQVIGEVHATDPDPGLEGVVSYRLIGDGKYKDRFSINSKTGVISAITPLSISDSPIDLQIEASDNGKNSRRTASTTMRVEIIESRSLKFLPLPTTVYISTEKPVGSVVLRVSAQSESEENVKFRVLQDNSQFIMDLDLLRVANHLTEGESILTIRGETQTSHVDHQLRVIVMADRDKYPVFPQLTYDFDVSTDGRFPRVVHQFDAKLQNGRIRYTFFPTSPVPSGFFLDENTGELFVTSQFKAATNGATIFVVVRAVNVHSTKFYSDVGIAITPISTTTPLLRFQQSVYNFEIFENQKLGSPIGTVSWTGGVPEKLKISPDDSFLGIHPNGTLFLKEEVDAEDENLDGLLQDFTIIASDDVKSRIQIAIRDVNEFSPEFDEEDVEMSLEVAALPGTTIGRVVAHDKDVSEKHKLIYRIVGGSGRKLVFIREDGTILVGDEEIREDFDLIVEAVDRNGNHDSTHVIVYLDGPLPTSSEVPEVPEKKFLTWNVTEYTTEGFQLPNPDSKIISGNENGHFSVENGMLKIKSELEPKNYRLELENGWELSINVDKSEKMFENEEFQGMAPIDLPENVPILSLETKNSGNLDLKFKFLDSQVNQDCSVLFKIDNSGKLSFLADLKSRNSGEKVCKVEVSDGKTSDQATVRILVQQIQERPPTAPNRPPTFPQIEYTFKMEKTEKKIGQIVASDPDNDEIRYSIEPEDYRNQFHVDSRGIVTSSGEFEQQRYSFLLVAEDSRNLSTFANVKVEIMENNEEFHFSHPTYTFKVPKNAPIGAILGQIPEINGAGSREGLEFTLIASDILSIDQNGNLAVIRQIPAGKSISDVIIATRNGDILAEARVVVEAEGETPMTSSGTSGVTRRPSEAVTPSSTPSTPMPEVVTPTGSSTPNLEDVRSSVTSSGTSGSLEDSSEDVGTSETTSGDSQATLEDVRTSGTTGTTSEDVAPSTPSPTPIIQVVTPFSTPSTPPTTQQSATSTPSALLEANPEDVGPSEDSGESSEDVGPSEGTSEDVKFQFAHPLYYSSVPEGNYLPNGAILTLLPEELSTSSPRDSHVEFTLEDTSLPFRISKNGTLRLLSANRSKIGSFSFTVLARNLKTWQIARSRVNVTIESHVAPRENCHFEKKLYRARIAENLPAKTEILQIHANSECEKTRKFRYAFHVPTDNFEIDSKTGKIWSKISFDREKQDFYFLTVNVVEQRRKRQAESDVREAVSKLATWQTLVVISIDDVNDNSPNFLRLHPDSTLSAVVDQNARAKTPIIQLYARDLDLAGNLKFEIQDDDVENFEISKDGLVSTKVGSLPRRKVFELQATVTDELHRTTVPLNIYSLTVDDNLVQLTVNNSELEINPSDLEAEMSQKLGRPIKILVAQKFEDEQGIVDPRRSHVFIYSIDEKTGKPMDRENLRSLVLENPEEMQKLKVSAVSVLSSGDNGQYLLTIILVVVLIALLLFICALIFFCAKRRSESAHRSVEGAYMINSVGSGPRPYDVENISRSTAQSVLAGRPLPDPQEHRIDMSPESEEAEFSNSVRAISRQKIQPSDLNLIDAK